MPPMKWTAMTSSASSNLKIDLSASAKWQTSPASAPIANAEKVLTKPAQGVTVARPATAPVIPPIAVALPSVYLSMTSQTTIPPAAAM